MTTVERVRRDPRAMRWLLDRLPRMAEGGSVTLAVPVAGELVPLQVTPARKVSGRLVRSL